MIKTSQLPELKQRIRKLLQEELCLARFSEDQNGSFSFHYERMRLRMLFDPDEASFVWIGRVVFWAKSDPDALAVIDRCIDEVNDIVKLVKLSRGSKPDRDGEYAVMACASLLVEDVASVSADGLERYFSLIKAGCRRFWDLHRAATNEDMRAVGKVEPVAVGVVRH
jgi:hypothetical protein